MSASAKPSAAQNAAWAVYEDDWVRAEYPPGSEVVGAKNGKQDPKNPGLLIVPPSSAGETMFGSIDIKLDPKSQGMLLRDAIHSEIRDDAPRGSIVLNGPKEFPVKNARCLGVLLVSPDNKGPVGQPDYFLPSYRTLCDGPNGKRYYLLAILSKGRNPKALTPDAQREAAIYERILNSLEFKKS